MATSKFIGLDGEMKCCDCILARRQFSTVRSGDDLNGDRVRPADRSRHRGLLLIFLIEVICGRKSLADVVQ